MTSDDTRPLVLRLSRRQTLVGLGAALGAMTLATGGTFAQETPRRGGTLNVMLELDTRSLDPLYGNATTVQRKLYNLFAESLLMQDEQGGFLPWLAESWEVGEDGKAVTFHLRKGVTFSDGTPFDAAAAKANLDRFLVTENKPYPSQYFSELSGVDVVDDHTITAHLSAPSVLFLPMCANEAGAMISPTALKELGDKFGTSPVGTGPFRIVSRTTGEVVAERNPTYWRMGADGKPLPYLDGVKVTINGDSNIRLLQLESGTAQLTDQVSVKDFDRVQRNASLELLDPPLGGVFQVNFNVTRPPLDNIDLRKALALAIDRQALVQVVTFGNGSIAASLEPPTSWVYDASLKPHEYNPEEARRLYAASGHSGPLSLSIIQRDPDAQIAEMLQQMYRQVGIDLKIDVLERLAFTQKVLGYDYDIAMARFPLQRPDPHTQYTFSYSRTASTNYSGMKNEEIFDLVDQARRAPDNEKRKALYLKIRQLVNDNYYSSFMFLNPQREVASKTLHNIRHDGATTWLYDEMWLEG